MSDGALHFKALLQKTDFDRSIEQIRRQISGLSQHATQETTRMDSGFKNLAGNIGMYFSAGALYGFTKEMINIRGEFQKTEIAFGTMLGSSAKASELMGEMVTLAAQTPFSLQEVSAGAKQLLAFQVPAEQVVDTLERMGNIASGLGVPLERINLVYGQVRAKGRLMGDDLRQFTEAGIPMVAELAKKFDTSTASIMEMVSAGKIGFQDVQDVLFNMTNEGGMFFDLMKKQSASLAGQVANLGDNFDMMFNDIAEGNNAILSGGIAGLSYLVDNYEEVARVLAVLVATYGAYRVALQVTSMLQTRAVAPALIQGLTNLIGLIRGATTAQASFNAVSLANPFILLATAIAGVVAVTIAYRKEIGETLGIIDELNEKQRVQLEVEQSYTETFSKGVAEKVSGIQQLIYAIKNEYSSLDQRKEAYKKLIAIDKTFIGTLDAQFNATWKLDSAFSSLIKRMEAYAMAQAEMSVQQKKFEALAEAQMNLGTSKVKWDDVTKGMARLNAEYKAGKLTQKEYFKEVDKLNGTDIKKTLNEQAKGVKELTKETEYMTRANAENIKALQKGIAVQEAQLRGGRINGKAMSAIDRTRIQAELAQNKEILRMKLGLKDEVEKVEEPLNSVKEDKPKKDKHKRDLAEVYAIGSIKELQQRVELWNEAIDRAKVGGSVDVMAKNKFGDSVKTGAQVDWKTATQARAKAEAEADEAIKQSQIMSLQEVITENERKWNNYYAMREQYGDKSAREQYAPLLEQGESFFAFLEKQRASLEALQSQGMLSNQQREDLAFLVEKMNELTGTETPLENFKQSIDDQLAILPTYIQQLAMMDAELAKTYEKEGRSDVYIAQENAVNERKKAIQEAQKQEYINFLASHKSFEQQKAQISEEYANIRAQIESLAQSGQIDTGEKTRQLEVAGKAEAEALTKAFLDTVTNNGDYARAFQEMEARTNEELIKMRDNLVKKLAELKSIGGSAEGIKFLENNIKQLNSALTDRSPFPDFIGAIKSLGDESLSTSEKLKILESANAKFQENLGFAKGAIGSVKGIFNDLGISMDNAFGDAMAKLEGVLEGVSQVSDGLTDMGKGFLTGNPVQMVSGAIKAIGGVVKSVGALFNNDRKKERNIKQWAKEVENLKTQYEMLERQIKKALGDGVYSAQQSQIANLQQQKQVIMNMMREEDSKKGTDDGKISEWQQQLHQIDGMIDDIRNNIIKTVLQTDAKDLAGGLIDSLVDSLAKGEDAFKALDKVSGDVFRNMIKNAVKLDLEKQLKPILDEVLNATGFNDKGEGKFKYMTPEQIAHYKELIAKAGLKQAEFFEQYAELFENLQDPTTAEGEVKGVTEQTASILVGLLNGLRVNVAEGVRVKISLLQVANLQLVELIKIEENTRHLFFIRKDINDLNSKIEKDRLRGSGIV